LIGGSVGLALRHRKLCRRIIGVGRREESLQVARRVGAVDHTTTELEQGVSEAELIVVCSPVMHIAKHVLSAAKLCPAGALITDAGSTKEQILDEIKECWDDARDVQFVGSHPIAGSEKAGPEAARADLFEQRLVVVTPDGTSGTRAVESVEQFWQSLGARTIRRSPANHDRLLAASSHMPHVVASALAACTSNSELPFTGSGWADMTRIAAGDVQLWQQILTENQSHVLQSLDKFMEMLDGFRTAIEAKDKRKLVRLLTAGKKKRDAVGS